MSKLIVLRGPSGAGKSTVAELLHSRAVAKTARFEQDFFRHKMFNNKHRLLEAPRHVMFAGMLAALNSGCDVIAEGILSMRKYQPYFDELLHAHPEENYFFYFDTSLEETFRRHATRAKSQDFGEASMREWFERAGPTGYDNEYHIPESMSAQEAYQYIGHVANLELHEGLYTDSVA